MTFPGGFGMQKWRRRVAKGISFLGERYLENYEVIEYPDFFVGVPLSFL